MDKTGLIKKIEEIENIVYRSQYMSINTKELSLHERLNILSGQLELIELETNYIQRFLPYQLRERIRERLYGRAVLNEKRNISIVFMKLCFENNNILENNFSDIYNKLNTFYKLSNDIVRKYGGYIDKFFGNLIILSFGSIRAFENHPLRAVKSAFQILLILMEKNLFPLKIGIASGPAITGNIGTKTRMEYTIIGDTPNLASRIMDSAESNSILTDSFTAMRIKSDFNMKEIGYRKFKGKENKIKLFRIISEKNNGKISDQYNIKPYEISFLKKIIISKKHKIIGLSGELGMGKTYILDKLEKIFKSNKTKCIRLHQGEFSLGNEFNFFRNLAENLKFNSNKYIKESATVLLEQIRQKDMERIDLSSFKEGVFELLNRFSEKANTLLIIDNLHWVDKTSLIIIYEFFKNRFFEINNPILFSFTPFANRLLDRLINKMTKQNILYIYKLRVLTGSETIALLKQIFPNKKLSERFINIVYKFSFGIPLYIKEIIKYLKAENLIEENDNTIFLSKRFNIKYIPPGISELIIAGIDNFSENEKLLLGIISVLNKLCKTKITPKSLLNISAYFMKPKEAEKSLTKLLNSGTIEKDKEYIFFNNGITMKLVYNNISNNLKKNIIKKQKGGLSSTLLI